MRAARLSVLSQLSGGCLLLAPNGPDFIDAYTSLSAIDPSRRAFRGERFLSMITLMRAAVYSILVRSTVQVIISTPSAPVQTPYRNLHAPASFARSVSSALVFP